LTKFLVCALFYGDYPAYAARCAASLALLRSTGKVDIRIGLNEVSPTSRGIITSALPGVETISADPQIYKYPMVRRLVHSYTGNATHLMWFDDDSCLLPDTPVPAWLAEVTLRAAGAPATLGSSYTWSLTQAQKEWVRAQPWFTGRDIPDPLPFNHGGWIVVPLWLLRRFDWPTADMRHNGGDVAFGALLNQQGLPVTEFRDCVVSGADETLRESTAPRRGYSEKPLGS
jgi:hypothetical protein